MPFAAALSTEPATARAVEAVCAEAGTALAGPADLAVVFFSPHHVAAAEEVSRLVRDRLAPRRLIGCVGESVVGNDREVEQRPALSLWLARWSNSVGLAGFHLELERTPEGWSLLGWPDELPGADPKHSAILLLGDPYSFPTDFFLDQVNGESAGLRVLGGMASGMRGRGEARLLLDEAVHDHGAVGVLL